MKNLFISLVSILSLLSCSQNKQQKIEAPQKCEIDSIKVKYFNFDFNSIKSVDCKAVLEAETPTLDEDDMGLVGGTIIDENVLEEICYHLDSLQISEPYISFDTRLSFIIYYKNGFIKNVCANSFGYLLIDDTYYEKNNRLTYLIKNNAGAYSWFNEEGLSFMPELKDTSIIKEPFIESPLKIQLEKSINH